MFTKAVWRQPTQLLILFHLEVDDRVLAALLSANLETLTSLHDLQGTGLALRALETEYNLLGGLGLLVEDRLGLSSVSGLLAIVTTLTLSIKTGSSGLVLSDLVHGVLTALGEVAQCAAGLGNVNHFSMTDSSRQLSQVSSHA